MPSLLCYFAFPGLICQCIILWLIICRSPPVIRNYRFYLCACTFSDILTLFSVGILINPDFWLPYAFGATVNGLGRFMGDEGGRISFFVALFSVYAQACFQGLSIVYRALSIMKIEYPRLYAFFIVAQKCLAIQCLAIIISYLAIIGGIFNSLIAPKDISDHIRDRLNNSPLVWNFYSEAMAQNKPIILVDVRRVGAKFAVFGILTCVIYAVYLAFAWCVIRYLRKNSSAFSRQTLQLQNQLIRTLVVQLILPFLLIGLPFLAKLISILFQFSPNLHLDQFRFLFVEIHALMDSVIIVLLISPYRNYIFQVIRRVIGRKPMARINGSTKITHLAKVDPKPEMVPKFTINRPIPT